MLNKPIDTSGAKILIVDDDKNSREILKLALEKYYDVDIDMMYKIKGVLHNK